MSNNKGFLMGSLIGGLVGAAAALFLAPKSGKEMRGDLSQQANVMKERTGKLTSETLEKGSGIANVAKEKTATLSQVVTEQSSQIMSKVRDITGGTKEQTNVAEKEVTEAMAEVSNGASSQTQDEVVSETIAAAVEAIEDEETQSEDKSSVKDEVKTN